MTTITWVKDSNGRLMATWHNDGAARFAPAYLVDDGPAPAGSAPRNAIAPPRRAVVVRIVAHVAACALALLPVRGAQAQAAPASDQTPVAPPKPEAPPGTKTARYELGGQITVIAQHLFPFHTPYEGPNSLRSRSETEITHTYTGYLGARLTKQLDIYFNPEVALGNGVGSTVGLAGYTNGDIVRVGSIAKVPYPARYFGRWTGRTGPGDQTVAAGENQIGGTTPAHRLVLWAGKFATTDLFDTSSYANNTRTEFMNWALINNAAYDYAADTRGYSHGVAVEWIHPSWAIRLGSMQMPQVANGPYLDPDLVNNRGDQVELELHPQITARTAGPAIVRIAAYRNRAHMGNYDDALRHAQQSGAMPDITAVRTRGAVKYGAYLNFEQPLADGGATGLFGRFGWNDGRTESFAYTEADRSMSLGAQISGAKWRRAADRVGVAFVQNDLSAPHAAYLAAGGIGFQLGDGKLSYGPERILETYYSYQVTPAVSISIDYQGIENPGYNTDRGPASVLSLRLHLER